MRVKTETALLLDPLRHAPLPLPTPTTALATVRRTSWPALLFYFNKKLSRASTLAPQPAEGSISSRQIKRENLNPRCRSSNCQLRHLRVNDQHRSFGHPTAVLRFSSSAAT